MAQGMDRGREPTRKDPSWLHLSEGEEIVWESRPHLVAMGRGLPIAIALVLFGIVLAGWSMTDGNSSLITLASFLLVTAGGLIALVRYVYWTNTRYVITSGELYKKCGVVSRDVTQFRLDRVQNTSLEQSVLGRLLGYGDLTIYTAGSGDPELVFEKTPRPARAGKVLSGELVGEDDDRASEVEPV
ncbi:PH domain-containing protein [Halobacteria archaeon AArc-m2/3/4]|uniref:PH domain-containing protein n=1 Tax=Natronoglomus mannanivorans TaxID=2979990 RepID=A0AAP2Z0T1_9EURY|nr:PH domain-containing protein [Halobacteria archaeon AArc-xg1-1]MCU4971877.1 PH domain-containing protein [Halobacteria archaeon AArc-m2/3/4]